MVDYLESQSLKEEINKNGLSQLNCDYLDEFINILKIIESFDDITTIQGITVSYATDDDDLNDGETLDDLYSGEVSHYCAKVNEEDLFINSDELESWAGQFLISEHGGVRIDNIATMRKNGFRVRPGEADSYGWLTGIIKTKKGILVFG